jgi:hypothetical protein
MAVYRDIVVNDNGMRNTKGVQGHCIDALRVSNVFSVKPCGFHATFLFSDSRSCREGPAVSKLSLVDIVDGDAITKDRKIRLSLSESSPLVARVVTLVEVFPADTAGISSEVSIGPNTGL